MDGSRVGGTANGQARRGKRRQRLMPTFAWVAVCSLVALMFLFPLAMVLLTVLKTPQEASASPPTFFPHHLSFLNFENLFRTGAGLATYIGNSAGVSVGTTLATVVFSTLAGYGFGRFSFPGRGALFVAVLATMMIPFQAILTPLYVVLFHLGLVDTRLGLMLVYTTFQMPFSVFLMRNSFLQVPRELEEAAVVDGSGSVRILLSVMMPLVAPGMATVALFAFFTAWNEFLAALILISDNSRYTLPVLLQNLITQRFGALDWGMLEVGVLVTVVPCVLVFLILQKYYVRGLLAGAIK